MLSEPQLEVLVGRLAMRSITDSGEIKYSSDSVGSGIFGGGTCKWRIIVEKC